MMRRTRTTSPTGSAYRDYSSAAERDRVWRDAARVVRSESRIVARRAAAAR